MSPDSLRYQYRLAELHYRLYGLHVGHSERQAEALQASQDALDVYKRLLERVPELSQIPASNRDDSRRPGNAIRADGAVGGRDP